MKKAILILVTVFVGYCSFGQLGSIVNGDFEDWTNNVLFEDPDIWVTGNYGWGGQVVATKSTDKVGGNYSLRLESIINGNDTAFGYALHGQTGQNGPQGGIPYTDIVDTIKGWYKYDIQTGDSANIFVEFRFGGSTVSMDVIKFIGTQNTWTKFAYAINAGLATPDSVMVGFVAGNAMANQVMDGTWLMLDDVSFASSVNNSPAAIPNGGFEAWSDIAVEDADDWTSYNALLYAMQVTPARKTTDKNSGVYAMELETIDFNNGQDTMNGVVAKGVLNFWGQSNGIPYIWQPDTFKGYYKYAPAGTDTAFIYIQFTTSGNVIDQKWIIVEGTINTYTLFEQSLSVGSIPDSMQVMLWAGSNPGSILKVDDLELIGGNVGISMVDATVAGLTLYPNPAGDVCTMKYLLTEKATAVVSIYSILGEEVYRENYSSQAGLQRLQLNLQDIVPGMYLLNLEINGKNYSQRLIRE